MLSYGGLLKQKHKILNLDDSEDGNLINTSDEKTTEEEQKAHSIMAIWNYRQVDVMSMLSKKSFFSPCRNYAIKRHVYQLFMPIFKFACNWAVS